MNCRFALAAALGMTTPPTMLFCCTRADRASTAASRGQPGRNGSSQVSSHIIAPHQMASFFLAEESSSSSRTRHGDATASGARARYRRQLQEQEQEQQERRDGETEWTDIAVAANNRQGTQGKGDGATRDTKTSSNQRISHQGRYFASALPIPGGAVTEWRNHPFTPLEDAAPPRRRSIHGGASLLTARRPSSIPRDRRASDALEADEDDEDEPAAGSDGYLRAERVANAQIGGVEAATREELLRRETSIVEDAIRSRCVIREGRTEGGIGVNARDDPAQLPVYRHYCR